MRVHIDADRCNGNASCVMQVPEVFGFSDDGVLAVPLLDPVGDEHREAVEEMVLACPARAISVTRDGG